MSMRIGVTGANGFVGQALCAFLAQDGHDVVPFVRGPRRADGAGAGAHWDPVAGEIDDAALAGLDAVVHLAGETVAGRWTAGKKRRIRESRVRGTEVLVDGICRARAAGKGGPQVLVSASAIGYYPVTDAAVDETSPPGPDFLAEVCVAWERATEPAADAGVRVVRTRFGHVLGAGGGLLGKTLPLFRLGLGGVLGDGQQAMSWVTLDDVLAAIRYALVQGDLEGAMNVTAPSPVTNEEFTRTLGKVLGRPTVFGVPALALKAVLGEFSVEVLASHRVLPGVLTGRGFPFRHPTLEPALRAILAPGTT